MFCCGESVDFGSVQLTCGDTCEDICEYMYLTCEIEQTRVMCILNFLYGSGVTK